MQLLYVVLYIVPMTASLTATEAAFVQSYEDVIASVADCRRYVTHAHQTQLDTLEGLLGEARAEELREVAQRRRGIA